jgi:hypothetical protein
MSLIDVQRQILALCFRADPPQEAFSALGDARAWRAYREMVRERLLSQIRAALPRMAALVGRDVLERAFVRQLEQAPPRSRYFRDIVGAFVRATLPLWAADSGLHPASCDLARYELALWEVADLEADPVGPPVREFSFDRPPLVSGALQLLSVSHAVHVGDALAPGQSYLFVHRALDGDRPRTWSLTRATYELTQRLVRGDESVSDSVKQLARAAGVTVDRAYVDALCETLAQFIDVGIVRGSR